MMFEKLKEKIDEFAWEHLTNNKSGLLYQACLKEELNEEIERLRTGKMEEITMPLYCYMIETGYYDSKETKILGHKNKYTQEEFDNICIEITEKHGNVEETEYFSSYDTSDVEDIVYNIDSGKLIEYLVAEYGFTLLDVPVNDGYNVREVSRKLVPSEDLMMISVESLNGECKGNFYARK